MKEVTDIATYVYELDQKSIIELVTFMHDTIQNHRKQYGYVDEQWHLQQLIDQCIDGNMYEPNDDIILMIILYYIDNIFILMMMRIQNATIK